MRNNNEADTKTNIKKISAKTVMPPLKISNFGYFGHVFFYTTAVCNPAECSLYLNLEMGQILKDCHLKVWIDKTYMKLPHLFGTYTLKWSTYFFVRKTSCVLVIWLSVPYNCKRKSCSILLLWHCIGTMTSKGIWLLVQVSLRLYLRRHTLIT